MPTRRPFCTRLPVSFSWNWSLSPWSQKTDLVSVAVPVAFFALVTGSYLAHAAMADRDNQFLRPHGLSAIVIPRFILHSMVWLLIIGEVGGFVLLFVGPARAILGAH